MRWVSLVTAAFAVSLWARAYYAYAAEGAGTTALPDLFSWASTAATMLAGILVWLLYFFLPAKDKQIENFFAQQHAFVKAITDAHGTEVQAIIVRYDEMVKQQRQDCERSITEQRANFQQMLEMLSDRIDSATASAIRVAVEQKRRLDST